MLDKLLQLSLAHRLVVVIITVIVAVSGVWAFQHLKLEAYPDLSDPGVVVITLYPGFAAEEVEQQVTVPIERALKIPQMSSPGAHAQSSVFPSLS